MQKSRQLHTMSNEIIANIMIVIKLITCRKPYILLLVEVDYTPPIAEILCVINPRAMVVCGFLMKSL